jgi:hypothetical protein
MKMLFTLPPIILLSLYVAVVYGILYLLFCTFTFVFAQQYGFGPGIVGLSYLPSGIGMFFGVALFGGSSDKIIKAKQDKGETIVPEDRLPHWVTISSGLLVGAALFWYGWATQSHTHWIVPMIGIAVFTFGLIGITVSLLPTRGLRILTKSSCLPRHISSTAIPNMPPPLLLPSPSSDRCSLPFYPWPACPCMMPSALAGATVCWVSLRWCWCQFPLRLDFTVPGFAPSSLPICNSDIKCMDGYRVCIRRSFAFW